MAGTCERDQTSSAVHVESKTCKRIHVVHYRALLQGAAACTVTAGNSLTLDPKHNLHDFFLSTAQLAYHAEPVLWWLVLLDLLLLLCTAVSRHHSRVLVMRSLSL